MERLSNESSIAVSDTFAFVILVGFFLFMGKSMYDLVRSKSLSSREKTYFAFIISLIPVFGSILYYIYERNSYRNNRLQAAHLK